MRKLYERCFRDNILYKIIILYTLSCLVTAAIFYKLIPILLNYAPDYAYIDKLHGISYFWQYTLLVLFTLIVGDTLLYFYLRKIKNIELMLNNNTKISYNDMSVIKRKLLNSPYQIYVIQIVVPVVIITTVSIPIFIIQHASLLIFLRLLIIVISFFTLLSILNLIASQNSFRNLLLKINSNTKIDGLRIPLVTKLFLQFIPIIITAILFTMLIGYSNNIREKGNLISEFYIAGLSDTFSHYKDEKLKLNKIEEILLSVENINDLEDERFIITPKDEVISLNNSKIEGYFLEYLYELSLNNGGYVYDVTGETRGVIIKVNGEDGDYIVGVKFDIASKELISFYLFSFIAISMFSFGVLYVAAKSIANDVKLVADNLNKTASGTGDNLYKKLPVTSNDEISDLVLAFNSIQDLAHRVIDMKNVELQQSKEEIAMWYRSTVNTIRLAIDAKDHYTRGHSDRVSEYAVKIGEALNLSQSDLNLLRESGIFHDIGKIGIDDKILKKPGKLTQEEFEEIKKHPQQGALILSAVSMFKDIIPIILYHHERYDGKGYPQGLKGDQIPILAKILAVADAFDAMTTDRVYHKKLSLEETIEELRKGAKTQFDPIVAHALIKLIEEQKIVLL